MGKALASMKSWKKRVLVIAAALIGLLLAIVLLKLVFVNFVVDFWWFQSQGMTLYFFMRLAYRYLVFIFFAAVFFAGAFFAVFLVAISSDSPVQI